MSNRLKDFITNDEKNKCAIARQQANERYISVYKLLIMLYSVRMHNFDIDLEINPFLVLMEATLTDQIPS